MKIGILTSGGDCPGLNAVIRAIGLYALNNMENVEIVGIPEGYGGLIRGECRPLRRQDFSDILDRGGTILGTSRQPYKLMTVEENGETRLQEMCSNYQKMGLDCLFTLGGAGTHKTAALLCAEGCNVIGLPKTIDNDIYGTDVTFGFQTAAEIAAESIDRIRTTAAGHGRTMLVEIMGNKAGWLALHAGLAAGADMILIPEIPFSLDAVCEFVQKSAERKGASDWERPYNIIAVAEGAVLDSEAAYKKKDRAFARAERGESTVTQHLAEVIEERTGVETRTSVLGYLQRGGTPCAYDRLLSSRLGAFAADLAAKGVFGVSVAVSRNRIVYNALAEIAGRYKLVEPDGELVRFAKSIGIRFGDAQKIS